MNEAQSRLAIGTAQFGSAYGITNRAGQVSETEAAAILELASANGIDTIDTAPLYGASEAVIGRIAPPSHRIVTKTAKLRGGDADDAVEQLRAGFAASLEALRRRSVHALLVHDPRDLSGATGGALWSAMEELKAAKLVVKIGVSVYEAEEIDRLLDLYPLDIVQLPFNAIDDRLVRGGQLERLARSGVEVHARSLFLQGLLLAPADEIPCRFAAVRAAVERLDAVFATRGLSRLEGLLAVVLRQAQISRLVIGVTSVDELSAIIGAARRAATAEPFEIDLPPVDERCLNPSRWHELEERR